MKILSLFVVLAIGLADVSAVGPKVYNPPKVCECVKCACEECNCSEGVGETHPKTKENKVKGKYLTYLEAEKVIKDDEKTVLITYVDVEPEAHPYDRNVPTVICHTKELEGYKTGDVIVSKFFHGKHERISLNGVEDKVAHNAGAASTTQTVTWVKQCNNGVCTMVPVYSVNPPQYYIPSVSYPACSGPNCPK